MKFPSGRSELVRILVADSNQIQSQLLTNALRRQPNFRVTCCRTDLANCLSAVAASPTDIVLLNNGVSDRSTILEIIRSLHSTYPKALVILLLDTYDRDFVVDTMRNGARGLFCLESQPFKVLCRCISSVHKGQVWVNSEQLLYLVEALSNPTAHVVNVKGEVVLTEREEQVVSLVAEGTSNREIAQELGIKENTVKKCLLHVYDKLGVCNRVELVLYALSHRSSLGCRTAEPVTALPDRRLNLLSPVADHGPENAVAVLSMPLQALSSMS